MEVLERLCNSYGSRLALRRPRVVIVVQGRVGCAGLFGVSRTTSPPRLFDSYYRVDWIARAPVDRVLITERRVVFRTECVGRMAFRHIIITESTGIAPTDRVLIAERRATALPRTSWTALPRTNGFSAHNYYRVDWHCAD